MSQQLSTVYLCLGANMGDRLASLRKAVRALNMLDEVNVVNVSSVYETEPWGMTEQPKFLNAAVEIETAFQPLELLSAVKDLEKQLGRSKTFHWGPRAIDIDLILWGALTMNVSELTLPHAHFHERHFVLVPLAEIAPNVVDPKSGCTVAALLDGLPRQAIAIYADGIDS